MLYRTNNSLSYALPRFKGMNKSQYCDCVSTIAISILFITAVGLTIFYSIKPIGPIVPITHNFLISLPLAICSSVGLINFVILILQFKRRKQVKIAFNALLAQLVKSCGCIQKIIRYSLHPGRNQGMEAQNYIAKNQDVIRECTSLIGSLVEFETRDSIRLRGFWHIIDEDAPTVIYFGGQFGCIEASHPWYDFYKHSGYNILVVQYRGYGISDGLAGSRNQEMEAYLDAEAALFFVLNQGIDKELIIAHGCSLGSAYAASLSFFYDVKHLILDHPFTSYAETISYVTFLPLQTASWIVDVSYEDISCDPHPEITDGRKLKTDGFNTLGKVAALSQKIGVFVIQNKNDGLMPEAFGKRIISAKYPHEKDKQENYLLKINGAYHCDDRPMFYVNNKDAKIQFLDFLKDRGLQYMITYAIPDREDDENRFSEL